VLQSPGTLEARDARSLMNFEVGGRVVVLNKGGGPVHGGGEIVTVSEGYIGVRFDGESGWYEWPRLWCYEEAAEGFGRLEELKAMRAAG